MVWARLGGPVVVLISISSAHAVIHAYSTLLPLIYPLALSELHFSVFALGVMVAVANLAGGFLQLGAGLVTRVIRRHTLLGLGALLMATAAVVTAGAGSFLQFSAGNILRSIATSPQHPIGNSLLSDLYSRARHGTAIAAHVAGGNVGTVVLTPAAAVLLSTLGWRAALLLLTIPAVIAGIIVLTAIGERARPPRSRTAAGDMREGLRQVWRSRNLLLIFLASLIAAGGRGLGVVILVVPLYLKLHLHLSNATVAELYLVLLAGSVVGPLIAGPLSDRIGRRTMLLIAYPLSTLTTLAVLLASVAGPWLAVALGAMGLIVYLESPLLQAYLADEAPAKDRDAIFSLYFAVAFGIGALWAAAVGAVVGRLGFVTVFTIMAVTYILAGACVVMMREPVRAPVRR
jgi:MFS transporter, FSR family, fosmidomycin resistance protein